MMIISKARCYWWGWLVVVIVVLKMMTLLWTPSQERTACSSLCLSVCPFVFLTLGSGCCIDSSTDDNFKLTRRPLNIQTDISPPGSRPPSASYSRSHHQPTKKNRNKNKFLCHMFDKTESFTDLVQCWIFNVFKRLLYICL